MQTIAVVLVACLIVCELRFAASGGIRDFRRHVRTLQIFPCRQPQPRVMELEDVMGNKELKAYSDAGLRGSISPSATVLHRCQATGCCTKKGERCLPLHAEDVTLTFAVSVRHRMKYFEVKARNHTECGCMKNEDNNIK